MKKDNNFYIIEKFRSLSFFQEFDKRVRQGISSHRIAKWLQKEMCEFTNIKPSSLEVYIRAYKASLPPCTVEIAKPRYIDTMLEKMEGGIDELEELESLYLIQMQRVSAFVESEANSNTVYPRTHKELQVAADLLKTRVNLKLELGISKKSPYEVNVNSNNNSLLGAYCDDLEEEKKMKMSLFAGNVLNFLSQVDLSKNLNITELLENGSIIESPPALLEHQNTDKERLKEREEKEKEELKRKE